MFKKLRQFRFDGNNFLFGLERGKQRQVVGQFGHVFVTVVTFQRLKNLLGAFNHDFGQSGQFGDMNTVRAVGGAADYLMQEDNFLVKLFDFHTMQAHPGQFGNQAGQLMVMSGKQGPAAIGFVQMLDNRPGNGQAVEGGRAASDFIQNDKRAFIRLVQNTGGFNHFHHKSGTAARQIVTGADTGKDFIDNADMRRLAGHERTHLRHNGNNRILTKEG